MSIHRTSTFIGLLALGVSAFPSATLAAVTLQGSTIDFGQGGSQIADNGSSLKVATDHANLYVQTNDVSLSNRLDVTGDVYAHYPIYAQGNQLNFGGGSWLHDNGSGTLTTKTLGNYYLQSPTVSLSHDLDVTQNATIHGNLAVNGTFSLNGDVAVGPTNSSQTITVNSAATFAATDKNAVAITGAPKSSTTSSLLQIGPAVNDGNNSANGGTYLSINQPSEGPGSGADLLNIETQGYPIMHVNATDGVTIDSRLNLTHSSTNQQTNITTAVDFGAPQAIINTQTATTAAESKTTFTVNNELVTTSSLILATIMDYSGVYATNGLPVVSIDNITNGSFDVVISNAHSTNALNGTLKIAFVVH